MSLPEYPPDNYAKVPYQHIRVKHVPEDSPTPTAVVILELHRPNNHNAFTGLMTTEIVNALSLISHDPRIKAVVFTGHGRLFCAGADLDIGFHKESGHARDHRDGGGSVALAIYNCTKPVIGAINGSAVGVGITMTLPMTIRIVSSSAKIGFVFARRGLVMEACSNFFLPRLIGYSKAMYITATGAVYPSTSPLLSSLFSEILAPELVLPRALELAQEIAQNCSTVSVALNKDLMWRGPESPEAAQLVTSRVINELFESADNTEGVKSFLEKRPARFTASMPQDAPQSWPWWSMIDAVPREGPLRKSKL